MDGEDSSRLFIGVLFFEGTCKRRCSRVKDRALELGQAATVEAGQECRTDAHYRKKNRETNGRDVQDAASF